MPRICPLRFSSQHDPCCHIMCYHPAAEVFFLRVHVEYHTEEKRRIKHRVCVSVCVRIHECMYSCVGDEKCMCAYVLEGDKGM